MVIYQRSQVRKLPKAVQDYMRDKFNLPAEYLGILRLLEDVRSFNGSQTRHLSIFSPIRAREYRLRIKTIADLERHPEMVLFQGRIDGRGGIEVRDRRRPVWGSQSGQQ